MCTNFNFKYQKENIELRREKILELSAQGYNQGYIANKLGCSISLVSLDLKYIREHAHNTMREYNNKLPEEYQNCLVGINAILRESWTITQTTEDNNEKLKALSLSKDCYNAKLDLLTNVSVVEDVIKFVNKSKSDIEQTQAQIIEDTETEDTEEMEREVTSN